MKIRNKLLKFQNLLKICQKTKMLKNWISSNLDDLPTFRYLPILAYMLSVANCILIIIICLYPGWRRDDQAGINVNSKGIFTLDGVWFRLGSDTTFLENIIILIVFKYQKIKKMRISKFCENLKNWKFSWKSYYTKFSWKLFKICWFTLCVKNVIIFDFF